MTHHSSSEPSPLVLAFGGETVGHQCPTCKRLWAAMTPYDPEDQRSPTELSKALATECCASKRCEKHARDLGQSSWCHECSKEQNAKQEAEQYAKAIKAVLSTYGGDYLFREGFGSEGYFEPARVPIMIARGECPEWAFACHEVTVTEDDCDLQDHVAECLLVDHAEDAFECVDTDKLHQAEQLLFEACAEVKSYTADYSVVVLLKEPAA